jgi:hypothetical protein
VLGKHFEVLWGHATSGLVSFLGFVGVYPCFVSLFAACVLVIFSGDFLVTLGM